jgi:hypothetical protein
MKTTVVVRWALRPQGYLYASVSYDFNERVGLSQQGYNLSGGTSKQ